MRTLKSALFVVLLSAASLSFAGNNPPPPLSKVQLQFSDQQWVSTKTAKVIINVSAALESSGLLELQQKVDQDLHNLHDADWHITSFSRSQDSSGLERAVLQAEARLPESEVASLRGKVEALSKPGQKFTVLNIDYSPSFAELNDAKDKLRMKLYKRAIEEVAVLNELYAPQEYSLYDFTMYNRAMPTMRKAVNTMANVMMDTAQSGSTMEVSQQLEASANVVFASHFDVTKK